MSLRTALALLLACAVVAGCGDDTGDGGGGDNGTEAPGPEPTALELTFDDGEGERATATLRCATDSVEATGWLAARDERRLCRQARRLGPFLASEPDREMACTQIYGGPQTARITGRVGGREVDRRFSRENGCRIADWDRAQPLLPRPSA